MAKLSMRVFAKLKHLDFKYRLCDLEYLKFGEYYRIKHNSIMLVYPDFYTEYPILEKQYNNLRNKRKRYRKQLSNMLFKFGQLYMVSLTFNDECFSSTDFDSRKKYVQRWCKEYTLDYYGCVDYGKKNGREHYHIIVALDTPFTYEFYRGKRFIRFDGLDLWSYGFSSCRFINCSLGNAERSLNYAFKSALYSFKSADTCNFAKPFHSRGVDYSFQYAYNCLNDLSLWQ